MATAKANKKVATAVELPECPVCMETMTSAIFLCQSGHSLCNTCTSTLTTPNCPICRQPMTQMRNRQLEEIIAKAKLPCPNKDAGCIFVLASNSMEDHLKECIYRQMECPIGAIFGRCSWTGKLFNMMDHFKDRHANHCNVSSDTEVEIQNVSEKEDDRHVFLVAQAKLLFIITMKIDTLQKMAYWTIQHFGSKKVARQHVYEIHVTSKQDSRRKVVFMEHCFNDAIKADEIFRQAKCGILPLDALAHFIKDKKMSFRFFIKRIPSGPDNNPSKGDDKNGTNNKHKGPKPPGPKGPGPKGPGATKTKVRRYRKMVRGGMRQVGVLATCALAALDETVLLLGADHCRALCLAKGRAIQDHLLKIFGS